MRRSIALLLILLSTVVNAQIYIYQPDESRSVDASLGYHTPYGTQDVNYENDQYLKAFTFSVNGEINKNRGVFDFLLNDVSGYIRSNLVSAKLSLFATGYINSTLTGHMGSNSATLKRIIEPWSESVVTWNNAPAATNVNMVILPPSISSVQDYLDIDVTDMVRDILADPGASSGFLLQLLDEQPGNALAFYSSGAPDPAKRPRLELNYSPNSAQIMDGSKRIVLYPNPATGIFSFGCSDEQVSGYEIINASGQTVYKKYLNLERTESTVTVDADLNPGIYQVLIKTPKDVYLTRLVRQ